MLIKQGERLINARNWSELVKPDQIMREEETASVTHAKFICEPLERGYGTTIGNAGSKRYCHTRTCRIASGRDANRNRG